MFLVLFFRELQWGYEGVGILRTREGNMEGIRREGSESEKILS